MAMPIPLPTSRSRTLLWRLPYRLPSLTRTTITRRAMASSQIHEDSTRIAVDYHNKTKHFFTKYARGPHGLDWKNQPNPFRRYTDAPTVDLLHCPIDNSDIPYPQVYKGIPPPKPLNKATISQLFYDSLALSAWKTTGISTWSLRVNPSSGNLHPTEGYILSGPIDGVSDLPFLAHYSPKEHRLEVRAEIPSQIFGALFKGFSKRSFFVGLSSIFWRESWKYGERAFRYCNHDVGHAIGAISMAAAVLGWDVRVVDELGHDEVGQLLGLVGSNKMDFEIPEQAVRGYFPQLEKEHGDCLLVVFPSGSQGELNVNPRDFASVASEFLGLEFRGRSNALSREHVCWDIIYRTANATKKPLADQASVLKITPLPEGVVVSEGSYKFGVREVIRKRRSAVDMDPGVSIDRNTFYQILAKVLPSGIKEDQGEQSQIPFRALPWEVNIHLMIFVNRVAGLKPGLYFLVRNKRHFDALRKATRSEFQWAIPEGCPAGLPLYLLASGDCKDLAMKLSCHQEIAGNGCFSLGMLAQFQNSLSDGHAWMYPRLFWEAGLLGQMLYLEAHAVGISATGIGCYFDDPVHSVLGLSGNEFQSLYHFTVGAAVSDKRIMSLPAYPGPEIDS